MIASTGVERRRGRIVVALFLWTLALGLWLVQAGFLGKVTMELHMGTMGLAVLHALAEFIEWRRTTQHGRGAKAHLGTALGCLTLMLGVEAYRWITGHDSPYTFGLHGLVQLVILVDLSLRGLKHQARITAVTLRPGWLLMGSFAGIIAIGTLLLKLPRAVNDGEYLTWLDALFTSTSAVCVTGLTVHNTAEFFSPTGHVILMLLFQAGGLGIMTLTFFMAALLFQGMSLHDRFLLGEMIAEKRLAHVGETLRFVVTFTFITEGVGAIALFMSFPTEAPFDERVFHAVFHSISAFCNAGFSTLPGGLADDWVRDHVALQVVIALLCIAGGLGSLAAFDSLRFIRLRFRHWMEPDQQRPRLRVHTRLVLLMTLVLVVVGVPLMYASDYLLHEGEANGGKVMTALFQVACGRTAGFNTVDMGALGPLTIHIFGFLMIIGGSPGGTAGGLRTTVFAVALLHLWNQFRGIPRLAVFRRTLPPDSGSRALGIIVVALGWLFLNFTVLRQLQPNTPDTALAFELVSAFATVGLSLDVTASLTPAAKVLILLNMFIGRVGLVTILLTMMPLGRKMKSSHPEEDILLF